jgi:hypothetical protein
MNRYSIRHWAAAVAAVGTLAIGGGASAQDATSSGSGGVTGEQIKKVLGLDNEKNLGTGLHFKLGIVLAMTGPGS